MAKAIKAIQCPKCGSTQKTEVRPDVFRCGNCDTEYYLDNDDININYTVRQPPAPPAPVKPAAPPTPASLVSILVCAAVLVAVLLFALRESNRPAAYPVSPYPSVGTGAADPAPPKEPGAYRWNSLEAKLYVMPDHRVGNLLVGTRSYEGDFGRQPDSSFATFVDAATGAALRSVALPGLPSTRTTTPDFAIKRFSNGDLYLVANKTRVYRADPVARAVTDVTKTLLAGQPELASGVASIEATDDDDGDGFNVFTNDGRNLHYYPLVNRTYTKEALFTAQRGFASLRPGSPLKTRFAFSHPSYDYPDDKIELVRYQYRDNGGGPRSAPRFEWNDDFGGRSGIFTGDEPHRKVLLPSWAVAASRIVSFADFTPGRLYFDPVLLYADADYVLLTFRPTAAASSPPSVQCLNARTAAIVFTLPLPAMSSASGAVRYAGGFVVADGDRNTYLISLSGSLLKHLEIK